MAKTVSFFHITNWTTIHDKYKQALSNTHETSFTILGCARNVVSYKGRVLNTPGKYPLTPFGEPQALHKVVNVTPDASGVMRGNLKGNVWTMESLRRSQLSCKME